MRKGNPNKKNAANEDHFFEIDVYYAYGKALLNAPRLNKGIHAY